MVDAAGPRLRAAWRSVRSRITAVAVVAVCIVLVGGAVALMGIFERSLTQNADELSRTRLSDLAALVAEDALPATLTNRDSESLAQVIDARNRVLASSENLEGEPPISSFAPDEDEDPVQISVAVADDDETDDYRVWTLLQPTPDGPVTIYVGTSTEGVSEALEALSGTLVIVTPLLVLLLALVIWHLVGRTLQPVEAIRSEVAAISHQELDRRVPVPRSGDEIARLAETMNEMLARLQAASARQQTFVGDASHELQSPVAAFRTQLEVALAHPESTDWAAIAAALKTDSDRMESLIRDLLYLARDDAAHTPPPHRLVDLDDLVLEEVTRLSIGSPVLIDTAKVSAAPVRGSADDLSRMVRNLLENAVHHASSRVMLTLASTPSEVLLTVCDDGPGVDARHRERIFDRFYRAEEARARGRDATGLGLAIARTIAVRHGGSVELVEEAPGACFVVRLPAP